MDHHFWYNPLFAGHVMTICIHVHFTMEDNDSSSFDSVVFYRTFIILRPTNLFVNMGGKS